MARLELSSSDMFEHAAQAGAVDALFELGMMYSTGRDVEPDLVTAHKWFNLASMRGNQAARAYRMELAEEMSRLEIAMAQKSARKWLRRQK